MPGLSKFTVSKFAVITFLNSVSKIQTLDTKMLLTPSASNTKENKFEHIPSEARQLRNRNLTVLWRTCKSREINKGRTMFCFFPYRSMTASSLRGWSQSDDSCVTLLLYKQSKRKLASVLHSDHVLKGPFPTLMQRSRLFLFWATAFV